MSTIRENIVALVLAAGKAKRMRSSIPKTLQLLANKPLLAHILTNVKKAGVKSCIIVRSPQSDNIKPIAHNLFPTASFALQKKAEGTGDAVRLGLQVAPKNAKRVLVLYGDTPFLSSKTLRNLIKQEGDVVILGFKADQPNHYGRILFDNKMLSKKKSIAKKPNKIPVKIIEAKDATKREKASTFCNAGVMVLDIAFAKKYLPRLTKQNRQKEYLLTDLLYYAVANKAKIGFCQTTLEEAQGIDTKQALTKAEEQMQNQLREHHLKKGVQMTSPDTIYFSADTKIASNVRLEPNIVFGRNVSIAKDVVIKSFSYLEGVFIGKGAVIGPFARVRPTTYIGDESRIGNFVEVKNAKLSSHVKAGHLTYLGDASIGRNANIGAGVITCNYDGRKKHKTNIGDESFIGSNTSLIAPIKIGKGARIGASSALTKDVAPNMLVLTRPPLKKVKIKTKKPEKKTKKPEKKTKKPEKKTKTKSKK